MIVVDVKSKIFSGDLIVHHMTLEHKPDSFILSDVKYVGDDYIHNFINEYTQVELEQQLSLWLDCNIYSEFLSCCYEYLSNLKD